MIKVQETEKFVVFSEDLGSRVRLQKREDDSFVLLMGEDAHDMLDKLRDADGNQAVMEYWISAWPHRFKRFPLPTFDNNRIYKVQARSLKKCDTPSRPACARRVLSQQVWVPAPGLGATTPPVKRCCGMPMRRCTWPNARAETGWCSTNSPLKNWPRKFVCALSAHTPQQCRNHLPGHRRCTYDEHHIAYGAYPA